MGLDFKAPCKFTLSANEIRQYSECARKRYYSSRDCLAIRSCSISKSLEIGKAVHMAFQHVYTTVGKAIEETPELLKDSGSVADLVDLQSLNVLNSLSENKEGAPQLTEGDQQVLRAIMLGYRETFVDDLIEFEIVACEHSFHMDNWPIGDVMYHGDVDMIAKSRIDGKYYFFEHKTCTNFRPDIYDRFDIQLHIYDAWGHQEYGDLFGGMILNQVKKAKTSRGYDQERKVYIYDEHERDSFFIWLIKKTEALVSPNNIHEPCNTYMTCKMCDFKEICLKFGYSIPERDQILNDSSFEDETGNPLFKYDPRASQEEEEA